MGDVLARLLLSALFGAIPLTILLASGPPKHGSWWYPDPARWDYPFKLRLYAILDANTPNEPAARWFVCTIAFTVLVCTLALIWLRQPCHQ